MTSTIPNLTPEGQRLADALPPEAEFADILREAVSNHNDVEGVFWVGVAREVAQAVGDAALLLTAPEGEGAGLREALAWYGEQARLARLIHSEGDSGRHALSDDGGKRAAAALAGASHAHADPRAKEGLDPGKISHHAHGLELAAGRLRSDNRPALADGVLKTAAFIRALTKQPAAQEPAAAGVGPQIAHALRTADWSGPSDGYKALISAEAATLTPAAPKTPDAGLEEPFIADENGQRAVARAMDEDGGWWKSCSGCHETSEGHETGHYPYSGLFRCHVGAGCSECGGLGVVWEYYSKEDFAAMAAESLAPTRSTGEGEAPGAATGGSVGDGGLREAAQTILNALNEGGASSLTTCMIADLRAALVQPAPVGEDETGVRMPVSPSDAVYHIAQPWFGASRFHFVEMWAAIRAVLAPQPPRPRRPRPSRRHRSWTSTRAS